MAKKKISSLGTMSSNNVAAYLLFGVIDDTQIQQMSEFILEANFSEDRPDAITIFINSAGGDLHSAFAGIEIMRGSSIPIHTVGLGQICSAGLIMFMSGAKGHRVLTRTCSIMSHDYRTEVSGPHHELLAVQKELTFTHERIIEHYKECTGLSEKIIKEKLVSSGDNWLSPTEALALGIADNIQGI